MKTQKPHLVVATGIFPPQIGGPATYAKLLYDELPKRGWEVDVVNFGDVLHLPRGIRHIVFAFRLYRTLRKHSIVLAQDPVSVGLPALVVTKMMRKKYGIRVAGDWAWEQSAQRFNISDSVDIFQGKAYGGFVGIFKKLQSFVACRADFIITPSSYFGDLVSGWGVDPHRINVIYNGISLKHKYLSQIDARDVCDISDSKKVVVSAGRLVPWKGFKTLMDTIHSLGEEYILYIIGEGPDYEKLEDYIQEKKYTDSVFLVGSVDADHMRAYLRASDVFVLNTSFESFSFQVVEALAAGVPVVTTNIGNLKEIVVDGIEGILVEPDNKDEIRDAIQRLKEKGVRDGLIEKGKKKAEMFSIERTLDNLTELLLQV